MLPSVPTRKKQKKRSSKKHHVPPSSTSQSSHIEAFFATYAPRFKYNPTVSASLEFYRLCDESGWDRDDPDKQTAHQEFKDALVKQFNIMYGTDVNGIRNWQNLCHVVGIAPVPEGLEACREAVYYTFVNLVDLVDVNTTGEQVHVFDSEVELSAYTKSTRKFFPRNHPLAGGVLQHLLRHIYYPRDGYDVSRCWGKYKKKRPGPR